MTKRFRPDSVTILSKCYKITYHPEQCGVNPANTEEPVCAYINHEKGIIRVYDGGRPWHEILVDIMHEILHSIALQMGGPLDNEEYHADLDRYATCIVDTLHRNGWLK